MLISLNISLFIFHFILCSISQYIYHLISDTICDQAIVNTGETSSAYPLLTNTMSLRIKSQDAIIILSTTSSAAGPRYEIVFDQASSNTTFLRRSQDGSSIKTVATSTKRPRYVTSTVKIHVWLDWTPGRVVVGMGERIILYYVDASALNAKYLFLKSPSSNGVFDICGRPGKTIDLFHKAAYHMQIAFNVSICLARHSCPTYWGESLPPHYTANG